MKFQNFQGPIQFSRTFRVLENGNFFSDLWPPWFLVGDVPTIVWCWFSHL